MATDHSDQTPSSASALSPVAIVTGGSSGIGQATCVELARQGFRVVVVGTNPDRISQTLHQIDAATDSNRQASWEGHSVLNHPDHLGLKLDVTQAEDMQEMAERTVERFGRIDILMASAGLAKTTRPDNIPYSTPDLPLELWQKVIDINLTGMFLSNQAVLPTMLTQKSGHILNVASSTGMYGLRGTPFAAAYCASKFGVVGLSESLAEEVESFGIRVQVFFPGHVETPMTAGTNLSNRYKGWTMEIDHLAQAVVQLLQWPFDSVIVHPCLLPFCNPVSQKTL